ncbi:MAG TPA: HAD family hydrolase [Arachnia sp.]|nr:HAD family hydrolase [Arachnia sp.]HMT84939.1 HAD family hydrolase [Arachnia sp.]
MTDLPPVGESPKKPPVRLVVFDFDDTLYDWIGHFVPALEAMITAAAPLLQTSAPALREQLKAVHERYGNTEQPFALLETESAQRLFGDLPRGEQRLALAPAFDTFDHIRKRTLQLYDDVLPTLTRLQQERVLLAGYSAAPSVNLAKRIKMLELADSFSRIYAAPFAGKPYPGMSDGFEEDFDIIETERPKPDAATIPRIARDFAVAPGEALFVGDSIASDIEPAIVGGARAALLRRGASSGKDWLPGLLRVSHRRAETRADSVALDDAALDQVPVLENLHQLWDHFTFTSHDDPPCRK